MKKVFFILFSGLMALLLMFSGCGVISTSSIVSSGESVSEPDSNVSTPSVDLSQPLITITSGGKTINTYESALWDNSWDGDHFLCEDCIPAGAMLPKIENELSVVTYADDFTIQYREDISFSYIRIFDENFDRLYNAVELAYLDKLPAGNYYIVIQVVQQGRYIISVSQYEYRGYECTFKLVVE